VKNVLMLPSSNIVGLLFLQDNKVCKYQDLWPKCKRFGTNDEHKLLSNFDFNSFKKVLAEDF